MHLTNNPILLLLVQLALVLGLSRVMGALFGRFRQPQVIGEMVAGIMLGPSLFGLLFPGAFQAVFPVASQGVLNALSQLGVIFFLFLIGLELDPKLIRNRGHAAVVISHASIIAPFLLGAALTLYLYPNLFNAAATMRFTSVALFMGAAMSVTAFPVLARILTERNLHKTHVGAVAITCAAVDDVTAWCMLAFVVAVARANGMHHAVITVALAMSYIAVMYLLVRPFLRRLEMLFDRSGRINHHVLAIIVLLVLASAYTTETIGIHALFGAFLMGAIMPKGPAFIRSLSDKFEDFTVVFLLPLFFAYTGLRTQIGVLNTPALWGYTALVIVVACLGKFGGSAIAARATGFSWRESSAIGVLMNTRGLMQLVILTIGKDLGVITTAVFVMMVIMAIVTTFLTTPILQWIYPEAVVGLPTELAKTGRRFTVLVPVSRPASGPALAALADLLVASPTMARRIIALFLSRPIEHEAYRSAIDDQHKPSAEPLQPILAAARAMDLPVEPMSFVSRDIASDIARAARVRDADLILMGFHKPVFGQAILGGTVHRVLTGSDCDVAVFVDRERFAPVPGDRPMKILVPYMGGKHDRLALDLAGRIARRRNAELVVLHVIPPDRSASDARINARSVVDKAYNDPTQPTPVRFQVIEDSEPVNAVIQHARDFDLVVIGVEEEWGLESHLFGWRPERVARECPASMLIVRKATPIGGTRPNPDDAVEKAATGQNASGSSASALQTPASARN